jgi:hypothetical protein
LLRSGSFLASRFTALRLASLTQSRKLQHTSLAALLD